MIWLFQKRKKIVTQYEVVWINNWGTWREGPCSWQANSEEHLMILLERLDGKPEVEDLRVIAKTDYSVKAFKSWIEIQQPKSKNIQ